jgi:hypothetical protein
MQSYFCDILPPARIRWRAVRANVFLRKRPPHFNSSYLRSLNREIKTEFFSIEREAGRARARAPTGPPRLSSAIPHAAALPPTSLSSYRRPLVRFGDKEADSSRPPGRAPKGLPSISPCQPPALELLPASRPRACAIHHRPPVLAL